MNFMFFYAFCNSKTSKREKPHRCCGFPSHPPSTTAQRLCCDLSGNPCQCNVPVKVSLKNKGRSPHSANTAGPCSLSKGQVPINREQTEPILPTTALSSKTAAPHTAVQLFASKGKVDERSALQGGHMLSARAGFTRYNGRSPLINVQPQLPSFKGGTKTCKGGTEHACCPPVSSKTCPAPWRKQLFDVRCGLWESRGTNKAPTSISSKAPILLSVTDLIYATRAHMKELKPASPSFTPTSAFLWSSFRRGPFATVGACKWTFIRVNRIWNGEKIGI